MKTITEFSGSVLRAAAQAQRSRPAAPRVSEGSVPAPEGGAGEPPGHDASVEPAAQTDSHQEGTTTPVTAPDAAASIEAATVGAAVGITGDRLARLLDALDVVGGKVDDLRMIRVLAGEDPPATAKKRGEFYFVIERLPQAGGYGRRDDRRGGRSGGGGHKRG